MREDSKKTSVFLIYVENIDEVKKLAEFYGGYSISARSFYVERLVSNYIIVDMIDGELRWGGNDLRPFGYYTPRYCSVSGGAMTVETFIEIYKLIEESRLESKTYVVPASAKSYRLFTSDGYKILHTPYFGMNGHTHDLWRINPISQVGVDSAENGVEHFTEEYLSENYPGSNGDASKFIEENFVPLSSPADLKDLFFITDKGDVIDVSGAGYGDIDSLLAEMARQNYDVELPENRSWLSRGIGELNSKGYIYGGRRRGRSKFTEPWIWVIKSPTDKQSEVIKLWIESFPYKAKIFVNGKRFWIDENVEKRIFKHIRRMTNF